jgi:hypothetical protein
MTPCGRLPASGKGRPLLQLLEVRLGALADRLGLKKSRPGFARERTSVGQLVRRPILLPETDIPPESLKVS